MKKWGYALAGLLATVTVHAQDEAAPATEAAPTTEAAPATEQAPAAAAVETTETIPVDSGASAADAAPSDGKPWRLYAGYDYSHVRLSLYQYNPGAVTAPTLKTRFGGDSFTSNFHQFRFGTRLFDFVGVEAHYGVSGDSGSGGSVSTDSTYGLYLVPTGVLFDTVEVAALVGYNWMELSNATASENFNGVSYGLNVEVPLRHFFQDLPDLRVGGGMMLYHKETDAQVLGYHFGLRYDFKL